MNTNVKPDINNLNTSKRYQFLENVVIPEHNPNGNCTILLLLFRLVSNRCLVYLWHHGTFQYLAFIFIVKMYSVRHEIGLDLSCTYKVLKLSLEPIMTTRLNAKLQDAFSPVLGQLSFFGDHNGLTCVVCFLWPVICTDAEVASGTVNANDKEIKVFVWW
jgi:hypothetical protein